MPRPPSLPFPSDGEFVHAVIDAVGARLSISDRRMVVSLPESQLILLDMPHVDLRRIQFDIERDRPATLVLVPMTVSHEPQVLAIPSDQYEITARGLSAVGQVLADS